MRSVRSPAVVALLVLLSACSGGDVTESDEYLTLEQENDGLTASLATLESEIEQEKRKLAVAEESLDNANSDLASRALELEAALSDAVDANDSIEALEAEMDTLLYTYPDAVKDGFIEGCLIPDEFTGDVPAENLLAFCTCTIDEMEAQVSVIDFLEFLALTASATGDINPFTGLPASLDDNPTLDLLTESSASCTTELF
ncbi:MAG: hypothetical protein ACR2OI_11580 [Acidimicrobiia bacterium]